MCTLSNAPEFDPVTARAGGNEGNTWMSLAKPIPTLRGEEKTYFEEAKAGRLVYQRCGGCKAVISYPRVVCPSCMSEDLQFVPSAGRGTIYSHTTLYRAGHPAFADDVPYTIVLVDLDEGARVIADLVDSRPEDVAVGMAVEVLFDPVTEDFTVPRFRLADATEAAR